MESLGVQLAMLLGILLFSIVVDSATVTCGNGLCESCEYNHCPPDCPSTVVRENKKPADLLGVKGELTVAASKSMTLNDLNWAQTSNTITTVPNCGLPSCKVRTIKGSQLWAAKLQGAHHQGFLQEWHFDFSQERGIR